MFSLNRKQCIDIIYENKDKFIYKWLIAKRRFLYEKLNKKLDDLDLQIDTHNKCIQCIATQNVITRG